MRLKDEVMNRKNRTAITHESIQKRLNSPKMKQYDLFLQIVDRLVQNISDDEDIYCHKSMEIFNEIEKRHIDISDIIDPNMYNTFKKQIIEYNVVCPIVGKIPESKQNISDVEKRLTYLREHPDVRF